MFKFSKSVCVASSDFPETFMLFSDPGAPVMAGMVDFHNDVSSFLIIIVVLVLWILSSAIFLHSPRSLTGVGVRQSRVVCHNDFIEIAWTAIPALIMLLIALPSFALLYSVDEVVGTSITLKVVGHQWYWHYEYSFCNLGDGASEYDTLQVAIEEEEIVPVEWAMRHSWAERIWDAARFQRQIEQGMYRMDPPAVLRATGWLDDWFYGFEKWTYSRNYGAWIDRAWDIQVWNRLPGPNTLSMEELVGCQRRLHPMFNVLQRYGITQYDVTECIGATLGPDVMAKAMIADRDAWAHLYKFFCQWTEYLEAAKGPRLGVNNVLQFDSYMLAAEDTPSHLRLLAVDRPILLPLRTHIRVLVTAADVLHSWAVPALGLKVDACPGRLNQIFVFANRVGEFYGQCSEICGVNHGFMPIHIRVVDNDDFWNFISNDEVRREYLAFSPEDPDGNGSGGPTPIILALAFMVCFYGSLYFFARSSRHEEEASVSGNASANTNYTESTLPAESIQTTDSIVPVVDRIHAIFDMPSNWYFDEFVILPKSIIAQIGASPAYHLVQFCTEKFGPYNSVFAFLLSHFGKILWFTVKRRALEGLPNSNPLSVLMRTLSGTGNSGSSASVSGTSAGSSEVQTSAPAEVSVDVSESPAVDPADASTAEHLAEGPSRIPRVTSEYIRHITRDPVECTGSNPYGVREWTARCDLIIQMHHYAMDQLPVYDPLWKEVHGSLLTQFARAELRLREIGASREPMAEICRQHFARAMRGLNALMKDVLRMRPDIIVTVRRELAERRRLREEEEDKEDE